LDTVSTKPTKGTSAGHSGSNSLLSMPVSEVILRNCLDKKVRRRRRRETWIFGLFSVFKV